MKISKIITIQDRSKQQIEETFKMIASIPGATVEELITVKEFYKLLRIIKPNI